jgi:hypothetical protein
MHLAWSIQLAAGWRRTTLVASDHVDDERRLRVEISSNDTAET